MAWTRPAGDLVQPRLQSKPARKKILHVQDAPMSDTVRMSRCLYRQGQGALKNFWPSHAPTTSRCLVAEAESINRRSRSWIALKRISTTKKDGAVQTALCPCGKSVQGSAPTAAALTQSRSASHLKSSYKTFWNYPKFLFKKVFFTSPVSLFPKL